MCATLSYQHEYAEELVYKGIRQLAKHLVTVFLKQVVVLLKNTTHVLRKGEHIYRNLDLDSAIFTCLDVTASLSYLSLKIPASPSLPPPLI